MNLEVYFTNTYAIPIIIASALFAFLIVVLQYKNEKDDILIKTQKLGLSLIRFIAFFLVAILLAGTTLKHIQSKKSKPVVIVAVDNSESMSPWKAINDSILKGLDESLKNNELHFWQFGDNATRSREINYKKNESNYSLLLDKLTQSYLNANVGAVLLLGDGIFNQGADPVFKSKAFPMPVYTIGIGDTTIRVDAAIKNINHNKTAFLDNYFPVEVGIDFSQAAGSQVKLEVLQKDESVYSQDISISSDQQFLNEIINLKAEKAGINNYKLVISGLDNESNLTNNSYEFSIYVISEQQKILILGSGAHPDLAALNSALEGNQNYSVELQTGINNDFSFDEYDLVIAHQVPDKSRESAQIIQKLTQSRIPVLYIVGEQSSITLLNQLQQNISLPNTEVFENVKALVNDQFSLFKLDTEANSILKNLPPLSTPFGDISVNADFQSIAFQSIKNIETSNPLITIGSEKKHRMGFFFGEGIWRWRIYDYLQNSTHENFDKLILKIANYLIIKPNEDNFNIYCPNIFEENDPVSMQADLYNASNELINDPEIEILITAEDSTNYTYIFNTYNLKYQLNAGKFPIGNYTYVAKTVLADKDLQKEGAFRIATSQKEILETMANFQVLNQISRNTGGQFFNGNEIDKLIAELTKTNRLKSKKIEQSVFQKLLDLKWLFIFIVLLFSMEWFLRKFWGTY